MPAEVEPDESENNNEEHDAEDEEYTDTKPTDNDVEIINNSPIEPAPIAIDVDKNDSKKTAGVEEKDDDNDKNGVSDGASDDKNTGVHEDDKNTGVPDNDIETAGVQDNKKAGVQNNNETMYHPNTTTPVSVVFNGLHKRRRKRRDYSYRYGFNAHIVHHAMTQLLFRSGIKRFKQAGE